MSRYVFAVLIGIDILANAVTGGEEYQTLSCRIGQSIQSGGWASYMPWPKRWREHFLGAVFEAIV